MSATAGTDTGSGSKPQVTLDWAPHAGQAELEADDSRFKVIACGRRYGKTEWSGHKAFKRAGVPDSLIWWVAPTYDIADIGFRKIEEIIPEPLIAENGIKRTKPKEIELVNGSVISFRSADREDSLRGEGIDLLVLDEAAMIPRRAWTEELRPALSDTLGDMIAISTPKGRNWFYEWFQRGSSPDHAHVNSFNKSSYENPHVPDSEIDSAQHDVSDRVFRQEYLAEFIEDSGGVFEQVRERIVEDYNWKRTNGQGPYVVACDFARHQDWTVITALDSTGKLVDYHRTQEVAWTTIQDRVEESVANYPGVLTLDASRDNKIVSDLELAVDVPVDPVSFGGGSTKKDLIEGLISRVEREELTIPDIPQLIHELQIMEYTTTPAGNVRYHAPETEGMFDDCVDSLALAARKVDKLALIRARRQRQEAAAESGSAAGVSLV